MPVSLVLPISAYVFLKIKGLDHVHLHFSISSWTRLSILKLVQCFYNSLRDFGNTHRVHLACRQESGCVYLSKLQPSSGQIFVNVSLDLDLDRWFVVYLLAEYHTNGLSCSARCWSAPACQTRLKAATETDSVREAGSEFPSSIVLMVKKFCNSLVEARGYWSLCLCLARVQESGLVSPRELVVMSMWPWIILKKGG